jgi:hypothetical protein
MREKKQKIISALITFLLRRCVIFGKKKETNFCFEKKREKKIIDKNFPCMLNRRYDYCKVWEKKKLKTKKIVKIKKKFETTIYQKPAPSLLRAIGGRVQVGTFICLYVCLFVFSCLFFSFSICSSFLVFFILLVRLFILYVFTFLCFSFLSVCSSMHLC